jgi:diphosphomevalonate decarboxylase
VTSTKKKKAPSKRAVKAPPRKKSLPAGRALPQATAIARTNIALAKYWGKSDVRLNLPAVPSISMTLDELFTETAVEFSSKLRRDTVRLGGALASGKDLARASELLDRVRAAAGFELRASVVTANNFPTASGLASSASGFAALAAAALAAAGIEADAGTVSAFARRSSASAARSIYGGFVELPAGEPGDDLLGAQPMFPADHWDVRLVIAVTAEGRKATGSTDGMERSRQTSPLYGAWIEGAPAMAASVRRGLRDRDLDVLGPAMEQSTFAFHACALTSLPATPYFLPATFAAYQTVRRLRDEKRIPVYATMDAGPHVKALVHARHAAKVRAALAATPGVLRTLVAKPGPGVAVRRGGTIRRGGMKRA